ncbi:MAG: hypothetical protein ACFCVF_17835 [Kineosporiaceae bacterium]
MIRGSVRVAAAAVAAVGVVLAGCSSEDAPADPAAPVPESLAASAATGDFACEGVTEDTARLVVGGDPEVVDRRRWAAGQETADDTFSCRVIGREGELLLLVWGPETEIDLYDQTRDSLAQPEVFPDQEPLDDAEYGIGYTRGESPTGDVDARFSCTPEADGGQFTITVTLYAGPPGRDARADAAAVVRSLVPYVCAGRPLPPGTLPEVQPDST